MGTSRHPGERLRALLAGDGMATAVSAYDAMSALLIQQAGFDAVWVSGGGTANFAFGLPDCGVLSIPELIDGARRIASVADIPVIADLDDAGPTPLHVRRAVRLSEQAGLAAIQIEDTPSLPLKHLWSDEADSWDFNDDVHIGIEEAVARIRMAVESRTDDRMLILARTDACMGLQGKADAAENPDAYGLPEAIERVQAYAAAGADVVTMTAAPRQWLTKSVVESLGAPLVHHEIGYLTPQDAAELEGAGVKLLVHPWVPKLAAFEAFKSALEDLKVHRPPRFNGSQFEANRDILEAVDLKEHSAFLRRWEREISGDPGRG